MLNPSATSRVDPDHPWLGLSSFTDETRGYFFGRTAEIKEIFQRVTEHPLTVLYGQAGYGKTSLLGAGLVPKLRADGFFPYMLRLRFENASPLLEQIQDGNGYPLTCGDTLWEFFHAKETAWFAAMRPVIIFDQFEEIFTLAEASVARRNEARELFIQLADLVEDRPPAALEERFRADRALARQYDLSPSPTRVVLTLREDYLPHLEAWKKTMPSLMRNRMALKLLNGPQALEAVVNPGRLEGRNLISDDVGGQIVRFVAKRPADTPLSEIEAVPPLLSLLCDELNAARLHHSPGPLAQITAELVTEQGVDILHNFYTRCFERFPSQLRHFVEDRLLTSGGHRIPVAREDAERELGRQNISAEAIDSLILGRLLSQEECGGVQRLEIVHDKIAELAVASRDQRYEREAKEKAEREALAVKEKAERESREAREREEKARKERTRLRWLAAAMTLLAVLSVAGMIFGFVQMSFARAARDRALDAEKKQRVMAFEAIVKNAEADAAQGLSEKVVEELRTYLSDGELAENASTSHAKAKALTESAQAGFKRFAVFAEALMPVRNAGDTVALDLGEGLMLDVVFIPPGEFDMGSPEKDAKDYPDQDHQPNETLHRVRITKAFYIGKFDVTQKQYEAIMGSNPSTFKNPDKPVDGVSWTESIRFCDKLNAQSGPIKIRFALPTEAQWEYACRAGTPTPYSFGTNVNELPKYAWFKENASGATHVVGERQPNPWGLYDMHGNVFQWCQDWYDQDYYRKFPKDVWADPPGPVQAPALTTINSEARVVRGGSWYDDAKLCRSAFRGSNAPDTRSGGAGFRVVVGVPLSRIPQ